eukprot:2995989-Prymnesium_polylepis.1
MTANHAGSLTVVKSWALTFYYPSVLSVTRHRVAWQRFQRPLAGAVHVRWSQLSPHPCIHLLFGNLFDVSHVEPSIMSPMYRVMR